ncbi:MAG TPA: response regulator [Acidimicrobiales bacterium]|jgi:DNA-binding NarL/FixJ family response regulator|nr:response regulator [Acidimicrobiales bacterium]
MPAAFRVVVADDFDGMRALLSAALEADGRFDVIATAADGEGALRAVRSVSPDLVLLDLGMPGPGGIDVLPALATASPQTRVVVVSGFPRGRLAGVTAGRGAVGYVEKGLSAKAMVDDIVAVAGAVEAVALAVAEVRTSLDWDARSSATARRFVEETLRRWDCEEVLETVKLLVSELVTNSVVHGGSAPEVAVLLRTDALRIEVSDRGEGVPAPRTAADDATSGRGLAMVEVLASAWGVDATGGGKTVWFELPRLDRAPSPDGSPR